MEIIVYSSSNKKLVVRINKKTCDVVSVYSDMLSEIYKHSYSTWKNEIISLKQILHSSYNKDKNEYIVNNTVLKELEMFADNLETVIV